MAVDNDYDGEEHDTVTLASVDSALNSIYQTCNNKTPVKAGVVSGLGRSLCLLTIALQEIFQRSNVLPAMAIQEEGPR